MITNNHKQPRRKRSHGGKRHYKRAPQPDVTSSTLVDLADMIEEPEGYSLTFGAGVFMCFLGFEV